MKVAMGSVSARIKASNPSNSVEPITLNLLVDSGATFTVISSQDLQTLGIEPKFKRRLRVADGRVVDRDQATVLVEIMDKKGEVPVVFGAKDDTPVVGMTTLEILGFELDPITRQLKPSEYLLLCETSGRLKLSSCPIYWAKPDESGNYGLCEDS